jgi:hypothetical protein
MGSFVPSNGQASVGGRRSRSSTEESDDEAKSPTPKSPLPKARAIKKGSAKPHIRMRKLKPVPPGAFPQSPMAFPPDPGAMPDPGEAMTGPGRRHAERGGPRDAWENKMAGYGGQMIALDVLTPAENQSQLADTSIKQTQAEFDQQALPTRIQTMKSQLEGLDLANTKSALDLQVQRQRTKNEVQGLQQGLIANAFATFDPDAPDAASRWDEMIDKLVEDGAPQAAQFKGRYSPKMAERWAHAYSAQSPGAALSDVSGGGGGGGAEVQGGQAGIGGNFSGITGGTEATQFDRLFAGKSPQEIQKAAQSVSAHMAAVRRVEQSANPLQALQQEAVNLGYSQLAGRRPPGVGRAQPAGQDQGHLRADGELPDRTLGRTGSGIPQPEIPAELKDVGGGMYSIDTTHPSNPQVHELVEPKGNYSLYTDANGKTWKVDARSGDMQPAEANVTGKISGGGGRGGSGSVYEQKRTAWLEVHPGDIRGALDYAAAQRQADDAGGDPEVRDQPGPARLHRHQPDRAADRSRDRQARGPADLDEQPGARDRRRTHHGQCATGDTPRARGGDRRGPGRAVLPDRAATRGRAALQGGQGRRGHARQPLHPDLRAPVQGPPVGRLLPVH